MRYFRHKTYLRNTINSLDVSLVTIPSASSEDHLILTSVVDFSLSVSLGLEY